jgi:hypothetical protein
LKTKDLFPRLIPSGTALTAPGDLMFGEKNQTLVYEGRRTGDRRSL